MTRILLITGDVGTALSLRRTLLRFTGSRAATRMILRRIAAARRQGRVLSCMVVPTTAAPGDDATDEAWNVGISFA
jgi:hypothetical protein